MSKFGAQAECALKLLTEAVEWECESDATKHDELPNRLLACMVEGLTARTELTH